MAPTTRSYLLSLLLVSCSAWLLSAASATDALACPDQVASALASADYAGCQRDLTTSLSPWVLTAGNADAIARSSACQATLRSLQAISFETCVATISSSDSRAPIRVIVDKATLAELTTSTTTRRLRHAVTRLLQESQGTSFDFTYLYVAAAISLVVMIVACVLGRGGVCCFCIPIPLCC